MADLGFSVGIEQSELAYLKTLQDALNNFKNATALVTKVVQEQNNETGELIETYTVQLNVLEDIKGKMVAINKEYQATIKLNKDLMEGEIKKQRLTNKGITPAEIEKERKVNSMRRKRNEQAAQISEELKLHDPIFDILSNPNNQKLSNQMSLQISRLSKEFVNANISAEEFKTIVFDILKSGPKAFDKLPDQFENIGERALSIYNKIEDNRKNIEIQKESSTMIEWVKKKHKIIDAYSSVSSVKEKETLDLLITKMSTIHKLSGLTRDNFYKLFSQVFKDGTINLDKLNEKEKQVARYALEVRNKTDNIISKRQRSQESKELFQSLVTRISQIKTIMTDSEVEKFNRVLITSRKLYENSAMTKEQFTSLFKDVLFNGIKNFNLLTDEQREAANHFLKLYDMLNQAKTRYNRRKEGKEFVESVMKQSSRFTVGMTDSEVEKFNKIVVASRKFYQNSTMTKDQFESLFKDVLFNGMKNFNQMSEEQRAAANHFLKLHDMLDKSGLRTQRSRESKDLAQSLIRGSGVYKAGMTAEEEKRFDRVIIASRKFYENTTMTKDQFKAIFENVLLFGLRDFTKMTDEQRAAANHFLKLHDMLDKSGLRTQRSLVLNSRMLDLTSGLTSTRQISQIQALFKNIDSSIKNGKYSLVDFMREFSRLKGPESAVQILSKATNNLQIDIGRLKTAMEGKAGTGTGGGGGGGPLSVLGELMTPKGLLGVFRLQLVHRVFSALINSIQQGAEKAAQFDAKLIRIKTITQEINISDYEWKTKLLDISKQTGTDSIETLDAAYKLFSNNIGKSVKSLEALQEALIFGKISNSTAQASVDLLSFTLNAFKINVSESERVLGVLFKTIDLGNITAEEMANTLGMTAPLAKQLGISLEEFNTAAVVITQQGVSFETASTLIRNVVKELINPTDNMKTLFEEWGVSSGEAAIKTYGLYGVLLKLRQEIDKGGTTRLGELIEDMRSLVAVPALAGKGNLELFKNTQLAMASASDTYTRAKDLVSESSSTIIDKVLNRIAKSFIQLGSVLYDTFADLFRSDFGQSLIKVFETLLKQIELITLAVEALFLTTLQAFDALPEIIKKQFNLFFGDKFFEITEEGLKKYIKTVRDNMAEERKRSTVVLENLDEEIEKTKELIKQKERTVGMPKIEDIIFNNSNMSMFPQKAFTDVMKSFANLSQILGFDFSEYFDENTDKNTGKEKQKLKDLLASKEAFAKIEELKKKISEIEDKNLELAETTKNRTKGLVANIKMLFQEEGVEIDKILEKQKEKFKKISEDVTKKKEELKDKFIEEEITKRLDVDGGIFAKLKIVGGVIFALKQQARDFFNIRNIDEARNKFDTIRNILTDINKDLRAGIKKSMEEVTRIQIEMEDEAFKRTIEKKSKGTKDRMIKNRIQEIMAQAAQTIDIEESRRLFQKAAGLAGDLQADPKGQTIRQIREMQIQKEQQFIEFARNAMLDEAVLLQDRLNLEDNILAQETNINIQIERSLEIYKNIYAEQEKTLNLRKEELDVLRKQLQTILDAEGRKRTQVLPQEVNAPARATGGRLGIDNLIARVSPGEMIMSTAATNNWRPVLTAMNAGIFNNGGSTTTVGDINITMNQSGSAQTDVRELAGLLRREIRRGTIRLA